MNIPEPQVKMHEGIYVVRDDMIPGGTKLRYLIHLFDYFDEVVYATPAYGGAQLALAYAALIKKKRVTLFVAKRKKPHKRTLEAKAVGARVFQVPHGYLKNVQSKAKKYARDKGAFYLTFGGDMEETIEKIAEAAADVNRRHGPFDQVWSAAGSGVLTRGLQQGMEAAEFYAVQVGRDISGNVGRARIVKNPLPFEKELNEPAPFPACPNYDRKAWKACKSKSQGKVLFWNVLGPSPTPYAEKR